MIRIITFVALFGAVASPVVAPLAFVPTLHATSTALLRSTSDRPDERSGPQIHVMYVLPSDGADQALDTDGTIAASVKNWQTWLERQTGQRGLFVDISQGTPDITFARLPLTDGQYAGNGVYLRDAIERDLHTSGFNAPGKIYLVYYGGSNTAACGGGAWPPTLAGNVAAIYMGATYGQGLLCYTPSLSLHSLNYLDFAAVHEVLHTIGVVPTCAPHHTLAGHVSDSNTDLMYAGNQPWYPSALDVGRDDYLDAHIPGCLDLADSPYFGATVAIPPTSSGGGDSGDTGSTPAKITLTVAVSGRGRVVSAPAGIACPKRCAAAFAKGVTVSLRPAPAKGSRFVRWSGGCTGSMKCRVTLNRKRSVKAIFELARG